MKNNFKKTIISLGLVFTASGPVFANEGGFFVEPMLTYEIGEPDADLPGPFYSSDSSVDGLGLGARLGMHVYESMFLGLDARYSRPTYQNDDTRVDTKAHSYNYGPVIGGQMPTPFGIRGWAGYIIGGEMDVDRDGEVDYNFESASGYRIGLGVKLTIVSLNLEFQDIEYDEGQVSNASVFSGTSRNVEQTNQSMVLSISFPFAL